MVGLNKSGRRQNRPKMATGVKFPLSGRGGQHFGENGKGSTKMVGDQNMGENGRGSSKVVWVKI